MNEHEFETFLAGAYRAPSGRPERPDIAPAVVARVARRRQRRALVLGSAVMFGVGVVGAAIGATGLTERLTEAAAQPAPAMLDPSLVVAAGLVLMLVAAARNALRDL